MEMAIVAEDRKSMLQGTRRNPHIIGRNRPTTASEITIHGSIMFGRLNVDHQLIDPIRRQKPLQFLAIFLLAPAHRKTTEQFAEHNTVESNPGSVLKNFHRLGTALFERHISIRIEENIPYRHNSESTCSKSAIACKKATASSSSQVPAKSSRS